MTLTLDLTGNTIKADAYVLNTASVPALTLTGNAGTTTSFTAQCTTPSLVTAAGASQAEVITIPGVTTSNTADVIYNGGTNTNLAIVFKTVCTANTVTVTLTNVSASALNGTVSFLLTVQ